MGRRPIFCLGQMNHHTNALTLALGPVIERLGLELWGIELLARGRRSLLRIYIDSQSGVTLADCERASREVAGVLDVEDLVRGAYDLEVSSPGLDRPLFTLEQFTRFIGAEISIRLRIKLGGRRRITGKIKAVDAGSVLLDADGDELTIAGDVIEKARLVPQE